MLTCMTLKFLGAINCDTMLLHSFCDITPHHASTQMCLLVHLSVCLYVHFALHVCIYIYIYICMYMHMYIYMHMHMHMHMHMCM